MKGDRPLDPPRPERSRRVSFDVSAPTWALVQEAREAATRERGGHVADDELVAMLAQAFLASGAEHGERGRDAGRATYQIALTVCERCSTATQRAGADQVVVDEAVLERAECDAQRLGRVDIPDPPRATQDIPPRLRRAIIARHGGKCAVPGCNQSAFLDMDHNHRRADCGTHDPEHMCPLCTAGHHPAAHEGTLVIRGTYSTGFRFEHADGTPHGQPQVSAARAHALATALELLVSMGFRQREAQAMVDRAKPHVGDRPSVDEALRAALKQSALPGTVSAVREAHAAYVRVAA